MSRQHTSGQDQVEASFKELERVDISSTDHTVTINGGIAHGFFCDTAGEILKIDNTKMTGYTTLALVQGYNPIEVTKIWKTGSTIAGDIDLGAI